MSRKNVQNTLTSELLRKLHAAVLDIVAVINRPQGDEKLIREAAIPLERALFPLLILIERFGPIPIGELADRVGRDYTTVSRQVAKLDSLELVARQPRQADRRVTEAVIAPKGKEMADAVDAAREKMVRALLATWNVQDVHELVRLLEKFSSVLQQN
ncbi:MarR family winged helix-turn-helix transcriptional regulator [Acidisoma silvae]|uniref:Winged helix-turn-helix transcriptional regulator n=1 Tax=Acidisoma silvae TaxID=2802396 RepID=A0A964E0Z8_9PROT|nr:MarR family winged helix-turn-helix transcriptional regulator [Acidisoma silvae]MCB8877831.1 winged helix-turn-helix transcriptional regulator [Acidisoma silvae]